MGYAEAVQDAVQAVGARLSSESYRFGNNRGVEVLTAWQDLVRHSMAASSTTACAGAEELAWG